ncbi:MAG TPA: adenylate/guanylate cyclase domain-containing protein [Methylomirabilota bacterium]|nr:adenylate/guanylate cyclase domain-containing protein [Methylomirabilota bacterium]
MTNRAIRKAREQIAHSIRETLDRESRGFELRYAYARVACLAAIFGVNAAAICWPWLQGLDRLPPIVALMNAGMLLGALAILLLLRRGWYPFGITVLVPTVDAAFIFCGYGIVLATSEPPLFGVGMEEVAVICALVALSGGLRLRPISAGFSTASALLAYIALTMASNEPLAFRSQTLVAIAIGGLFGYLLTTIVRASLDGAVSRTIFRRFLPEHLVELARRDPFAAIGESRVLEATVLFSDLRNFTGLVESMPPSEVLEYLNEVQGLLASIISKYGGTVDKFMGDGMLAVFGAPQNLDDHPQQGIGAAAEIISSIATLNRERRERGEPAAEIGLGVHAGSVIAGCVGSGARLEFTVLGDAVNATSRLEGLTRELGVTALVSEETVRRAGDGAGWSRDDVLGRLKWRGEVSIRGRIAPMSVYSLEGIAA